LQKRANRNMPVKLTIKHILFSKCNRVIQYKFLRDEDYNIDFKGLNFFNEILILRVYDSEEVVVKF
jgi:hypothetical protein